MSQWVTLLAGANADGISTPLHHRLTEADDAVRILDAMDERTKLRLAATQLLLLDEVSMVSSRMFGTLVDCMESARRDFSRAPPWRMLAFGAFFQLPAVRDSEDEDVVRDLEAGYAFEWPAWDRIFGSCALTLTYVWGQQDVEFTDMLNELRVGIVSVALGALLE